MAGVAEAVVVVAVVEVEREEWVEVDGAIAAVDHRSREEDTAVVVAFPGRRASLGHRALRGQVVAAPAEWLRTGMSEVAI